MEKPVISQDVINLYDEFTHAPLPRRVFMDRLAKLVGGTAAASALLPLLENNYALAQMVKPDDARITVSQITFPSAAGPVKGVLVKPKAASGKLPAIIVVHENRGLNPHIEDVTRRVALEGYLALGVDFLSPQGGTPANEDTARDMFAKVDRAHVIQIGNGAATFLKGHADSTGKVGAMGFCWGGGTTNTIAVNSPDLAAAAPYYGPVPAAEDVPKIKAPLLMHFAGIDERINAGIPAFEAAAKAAGTKYTIHMYEGAQHAFNNDANAARYNEAAAKLAWQRTFAFFKQNLA